MEFLILAEFFFSLLHKLFAFDGLLVPLALS